MYKLLKKRAFRKKSCENTLFLSFFFFIIISFQQTVTFILRLQFWRAFLTFVPIWPRNKSCCVLKLIFYNVSTYLFRISYLPFLNTYIICLYYNIPFKQPTILAKISIQYFNKKNLTYGTNAKVLINFILQLVIFAIVKC